MNWWDRIVRGQDIPTDKRFVGITVEIDAASAASLARELERARPGSALSVIGIRVLQKYYDAETRELQNDIEAGLLGGVGRTS